LSQRRVDLWHADRLHSGVSLARLLSIVAPPLCVACGALAGAMEPLCPPCRKALTWLPTEPVELQGVAVWAPLAYEGPARDVVRALKFRGAERLAGYMAAAIVANAPPGLLESRKLVPVPLHPVRLRWRGFNQAEAIARAVARRTGLEVVDCLERGGRPTTQVGTTRTTRLAALEGVIAVRAGPPTAQGALVVDDVATTAATMSACADALRAAGCRDVAAIAFARTPGR
jgi:ComF family protein